MPEGCHERQEASNQLHAKASPGHWPGSARPRVRVVAVTSVVLLGVDPAVGML